MKSSKLASSILVHNLKIAGLLRWQGETCISHALVKLIWCILKTYRLRLEVGMGRPYTWLPCRKSNDNSNVPTREVVVKEFLYWGWKNNSETAVLGTWELKERKRAERKEKQYTGKKREIVSVLGDGSTDRTTPCRDSVAPYTLQEKRDGVFTLGMLVLFFSRRYPRQIRLEMRDKTWLLMRKQTTKMSQTVCMHKH